MLYGSVLVLICVVVLICVRRSHEIEQEILSVLLCCGEMYGLQIRDAIERDFGRKPGWGVLYPGLRRLERQDYVTSRWGNERPEVRGGARHRYYQRTGKRKNLVERKSADFGLESFQVSSHNSMVLLTNDERLRQAHAKAINEIWKINQ